MRTDLYVVSGGSPPCARLLTAAEVAAILRIAAKKVYELPIPRVALSPKRIRWREDDVFAFIDRRRVA